VHPDGAALRPTFAELQAHPDIVRALADNGIITAFPIQEQTLPLALAGQDLIGQAKTGTGKTLAFGIPLLHRIHADQESGEGRPAGRSPQGLVVAPTRELAIQVAGDLTKASRHLGLVVMTVYGGRSYEPQIEQLKAGVDVVVGTPGRMLDLAQQRVLRLDRISELVLDEADEMLDMGFLPDVERLVSYLPQSRQTMLFSATMPAQIAALARRYLSSPTHIRAHDPGDQQQTVDAIEQHIWRAHPLDKVELISRILQARERSLTMIFTETKRRAQKVADDLAERGFAAAAVHGDLGQAQRERALRAFRAGKVDVLVATDVAARGIDVEDVSHVINYECPADDKTYVHRVGRTGRAGASGVAVTLVDWEDSARWKMINKALGLAFFEPVETYSSSEHVYRELDIPTTAKGTLPRAQRTREGLDSEELEDIGETGRGGSGGASGRGGRHGRPDKHGKQGSGGRKHQQDAPAPSGAGGGGSRERKRAPRRRTKRSEGGQRPAEAGQPDGPQG
jgi:superfamily II DNA/RNA helicase